MSSKVTATVLLLNWYQKRCLQRKKRLVRFKKLRNQMHVDFINHLMTFFCVTSITYCNVLLKTRHRNPKRIWVIPRSRNFFTVLQTVKLY